MRHAADGGVHSRAAQRFGVDGLARGALHQVRSAQAHKAGAFHHDDDVRKRRQIGAPRNAGAHHGGDLRHLQTSAHEGVVVEDAPGPVLAGEDTVLQREVHAGRIHQVDNRDPVAHRHLLRAQDLGDGFGPPGAGFDRGVVGNDHRGTAFDAGQPGNHPGRGCLPVILVMGDQQTQLDKMRSRINQLSDAFARRKLAIAMLLLNFGIASAAAETVFEVEQFVDTLLQAVSAQRPQYTGSLCSD